MDEKKEFQEKEEKQFDEKDEKEVLKHDEKVEQQDALSSATWALMPGWFLKMYATSTTAIRCGSESWADAVPAIIAGAKMVASPMAIPKKCWRTVRTFALLAL